MSNLLLDDEPLIVLPTLATIIGLNESIVLQQVHYWIRKKTATEVEGRRWVYNDYGAWQEQFPFWSKSTIERTFRTLIKDGLLLVKQFSKAEGDSRNWYTINYETVAALEADAKRPQRRSRTTPSRQIDVTPHVKLTSPPLTSDCREGDVNLTLPSRQLDVSINKDAETPTETPTETSSSASSLLRMRNADDDDLNKQSHTQPNKSDTPSIADAPPPSETGRLLKDIGVSRAVQRELANCDPAWVERTIREGWRGRQDTGGIVDFLRDNPTPPGKRERTAHAPPGLKLRHQYTEDEWRALTPKERQAINTATYARRS